MMPIDEIQAMDKSGIDWDRKILTSLTGKDVVLLTTLQTIFLKHASQNPTDVLLEVAEAYGSPLVFMQQFDVLTAKLEELSNIIFENRKR